MAISTTWQQRLLAAALGLSLGACQSVDLVFNEQVMYTSTDLYKDYTIPDPGLRGCIERAILDGRYTRADQLRHLHCIEAGVESLEGLEQFPSLQSLDLTGNYDLPCGEAAGLDHLKKLVLPDQCQ
jgi:hypothetical protein